MTRIETKMDRLEPTTAEKLRGLPWAVAAIALNTVFNTFIFGTVFVLYLSELGLSKTAIGSALSLLPFAGVLAPLIAPAVERFGLKRTFLIFYGARKFVAALLLLAPWVLLHFGAQAALAFVLVIIGLYAVCRAVAETGYYPWRQEYAPASIQGKYTAVSNVTSTLVGLVAVLVAGLVVGSTTSLNRFLILIGVGFMFGLAMVWAYSHVPGGAPRQADLADTKPKRNLSEALGDRNFILYLAGISLFALAADPIASFLPLFMQEQAGLTSAQVVWIQTGMMIGAILSGYLWGWAADRYGNKPVILINLFFALLYPLGWMVMPRFTPASFFFAFTINLFRGVVGTGWAVGTWRLLFVGVVPQEKKTDYMAVYYAWTGIMGGLSQLLGGSLLDNTRGISGRFLYFTFDPYSILFLSFIVLALVCIPIFQAIRIHEPVSTRQFVSTFLRGNPLLAMESLIGFYLARDEGAAISVTQRLGQTRSLLVVEELLEALADPRFNVRFEAILAIAHLRPDPRLLQALSEVLAGDDPALGVVAAWALGRMGDPGAIPHLRSGLGSRYRSIRAHCSRSLGSLQDLDSIPVLLTQLKLESDPGLQVAYASTLGKLGAVQAIPQISTLLSRQEAEGTRLELALALARMAGEEHMYVQLARQLRVDPGTALSQSVLALRKKIDKLMGEGGGSRQAWNDCASAFSRGDFRPAVAILQDLLSQLPLETFQPVQAQILGECQRCLAEFGPARMEYVLLAVHILNSLSLDF